MSGKHINALDGVRGLAVLLVIFYHTGGGAKSGNPLVHAIGMANKYGWSGVTLFFVLSGFLITGILWDTRDDPHHLRNFYARRSLRIFPLYYASLALVVLGAIPNGTLYECLHRLWNYLFYLQNVSAPSLGLSTDALPSKLITVHFWSLAVEEQFYLLWPALILRMKSLQQVRNLCLIVFIASTTAKIVYAFVSVAPQPTNQSLWANAGSLALGGYVAADNRINGIELLKKIAPYMLAMSLCLFILVSRGSLQTQTAGDLTLVSIFWTAVLIMTLSDNKVRSAFETRWLRWIGSISYGMYIYHWLFRNYYDKLTWYVQPIARSPAHDGLRFILTLALTISISWLSFNLFENPVLRFKKRFQPVKATVNKPHVVEV